MFSAKPHRSISKSIYILFSFIIISVAGCASNEHLRTNLIRSVPSENRILMNEDASLVLKSPVGIPTTFALRRGVYKPELENEFGTFYRGPEGCVKQTHVQTPMGTYDGGIWMPKDKINNKPAIYYYFNYNTEQAFSVGGPVITAILEASKGDITFVPPSPDVTFLDGLYITNF